MREVLFEEWQWEEELTVFTLEEVGLGIYKGFCEILMNNIFCSFDYKSCRSWSINHCLCD